MSSSRIKTKELSKPQLFTAFTQLIFREGIQRLHLWLFWVTLLTGPSFHLCSFSMLLSFQAVFPERQASPLGPRRSCSDVSIQLNHRSLTQHTVQIRVAATLFQCCSLQNQAVLKIFEKKWSLQSTHSQAAAIPSSTRYGSSLLHSTSRTWGNRPGAYCSMKCLCTSWCCLCSGWYPVPRASSAGKLQITTKSSKKERLPKFVGSGNFLLLSCSPRLHSHPLFFLLLSSPLPVTSLCNVHPAPGTPLQLLCLLSLPTDLLSFCDAVSICFRHQLCHFFSVQTHTSLSCTQKHQQPQWPHHAAIGVHTPSCCFHLFGPC